MIDCVSRNLFVISVIDCVSRVEPVCAVRYFSEFSV